jgi:hypothetical protein
VEYTLKAITEAAMRMAGDLHVLAGELLIALVVLVLAAAPLFLIS